MLQIFKNVCKLHHHSIIYALSLVLFGIFDDLCRKLGGSVCIAETPGESGRVSIDVYVAGQFVP